MTNLWWFFGWDGIGGVAFGFFCSLAGGRCEKAKKRLYEIVSDWFVQR